MSISLEDITLKFISRNIYRFNFAYCRTKDPVLGNNFEFLRRNYSTILVQFLDRELLFNKSCLNFLINEHLKEVDIGRLSEIPWDSVISRIADVGHGLQRISMDVFPCMDFVETVDEVIDFVNQLVCHMPNLTTIRLGQFCNDTTLQVIANACPKLQELNADNSCAITNAGLEALCRLRDDLVEPRCVFSDLRILSLENICKLEDSIKLVLKSIPSLRFLGNEALPDILNRMYKDTCSLDSFRKYDLTELKIIQLDARNSVIEVLSSASAMCPNIKTIDVECSHQTEVEALCNFTKLEKLTIHRVFKTGFPDWYLSCNDLLKSIGKSLKELHFSSGILCISVLLHNCPNLEYLKLERTTFEAAEEISGAILSKLTKLCVEFWDIHCTFNPPTMCQIMNACPKIEVLYLRRLYVKSVEKVYSALLTFCKGSSLRHLTFNDCEVDKNMLESIVTTSSSLESLSVIGCVDINEEDIDHLKKISKYPLSIRSDDLKDID